MAASKPQTLAAQRLDFIGDGSGGQLFAEHVSQEIP